MTMACSSNTQFGPRKNIDSKLEKGVKNVKLTTKLAGQRTIFPYMAMCGTINLVFRACSVLILTAC